MSFPKVPQSLVPGSFTGSTPVSDGGGTPVPDRGVIPSRGNLFGATPSSCITSFTTALTRSVTPSKTRLVISFCAVFYCSELGDGWFPAVLETEREMDFIKFAQRDVRDIRSYRIGGETCVDRNQFINYTQYIPRVGDEDRWVNGVPCKFNYISNLTLCLI